jgi:hypothetical protein
MSATDLYVSVGGTQRAFGSATGTVYLYGLSTTDTLRETPNTATFTAHGFTPTVGQAVVVTLADPDAVEKEFGGTILTVNQSYTGTPEYIDYVCSCVDWTWGLNDKLVSGYFTGSATTIAETLIADYASGYTDTYVEASLATVSGGISFTNVPLPTALTRLCARIGGHWYCDYNKIIHLWTTADPSSPTDPEDLDETEAVELRAFWGVAPTRDLSQVVTRVYCTGGGDSLAASIGVGETILPVGDTTFYNAAGGAVEVGPQRVTYAGLDAGGGGSLVGPGTGPSAAPSVACVSGAGVETGGHDYAVTFTTSSGESIPGPLSTVAVGLLSAPASAPVPGDAASGTGPDPGTHYYAASYVTAGGETLPSVLSGPVVVADEISAPSTAPTAGTATAGTGVTPGTHKYATTFTTAIGETTLGPDATRATSTFAAPSAPSTAEPSPLVTGAVVGTVKYAVTFVTSSGETTPSGDSTKSISAVQSGITPSALSPTTGGSVDTGTHVCKYTYVTARGETASMGGGPVVVSGTNHTIPWDIPESYGDARITACRLYRSKADTGSPLYLVATVNVGTASYNDTTADASLSATEIPTVGTAEGGRVNVSSIATGPTGVTSRKLYRTVNGGSTFKLLATLSDNTTTTYADTTADASLGVQAPTTNTAYKCLIALSAIPTGPAGVTGRKVYRTGAGGSTFKLLATLSNNTTTTYDDSTADGSLGATAPTANSTAYRKVALSGIVVGDASVTSRNVYRTAAGSAQLKLLTTIADNTTTTYNDQTIDSGLGANAPTVGTATANAVNVTGIPIGNANVTGRKVYRTAADLSQLKLLATIADNSTTTYADTTADASLGANAPTSDASGLTQPSGQVLAGSTTLLVAGASGFRSGGGWVRVGSGSQVVRYTGISGNTLTGIPASGDGAILATIAYNSTATACPLLFGVPPSGTGSVLYAQPSGTAVNLIVVANDTTAQATIAALLGTDGIIESSISDSRLSEAEAQDYADATLALSKDVLVSVAYTSYDVNSRSGRTVTVDLSAPTSVVGTFLIQSVTTSNFLPAILPERRVTASSRIYTFEDLLRIGG